jgi:hypothetical protein
MEVQALKVETSINQFLKEIEDLNDRSEALTPMPVQ